MNQLMTANKWRAMRERFESSGLSQQAFCHREKVSPASFSYWKRKFSGASSAIRATSQELGPKFVEIDFGSLADSVHQKADDAELVVELPLGVRLRFRVQACA